ncbi:MAG: hypothetical protein ABR874_23420 [Candidatus Sulfotelmatobacter sp.]|jgi:hypothetical protein
MEALNRLVTDSLARHGFNRPVDPHRLQWSRWFLCDSLHSLLVVPSKPGIFAIAEEVMDLAARGAADAFVRPEDSANREGHEFTRAVRPAENSPALAAAGAINGSDSCVRRMLAVLQFSEDDDMAFTMDRMFTKPNAMRDRLSSGRCFLRFVVIEDEDQRRSICSALNQWMMNSSEKATGIPAGFSSSLELADPARVGRTPSSASANSAEKVAQVQIMKAHPDSGANKNLHCPQPFPSGF